MSQPDNIEIDFAKPGDEVEIAALIAELAEYEKAPEKNISTPESIRAMIFTERPAAEVLMARVAGAVAGFALFFPNFSTWLSKPGMYLEDLFVRPEFRNRGIAKSLLTRLAQICKQRDYCRFEWSCLEWNELAKGFYRFAGAKPMEEWRTWRVEGEAIEELAEGKLFAPREIATRDTPHPASDSVVIYTDGGCQPNPGAGGWAALLRYGNKVKEISGGERNSTNNRMELTAAIMALEALKRPCRVQFHTDSEYVKNGITQWMPNWKKKKWRKANGDPVLNSDLWRRLDDACQRHEIDWRWIKGHAGDEYNERCDKLCNLEIAKLKS